MRPAGIGQRRLGVPTSPHPQTWRSPAGELLGRKRSLLHRFPPSLHAEKRRLLELPRGPRGCGSENRSFVEPQKLQESLSIFSSPRRVLLRRPGRTEGKGWQETGAFTGLARERVPSALSPRPEGDLESLRSLSPHTISPRQLSYAIECKFWGRRALT